MKTALLGIPVKGQMPVWAVRNLINISRTNFGDWTIKIRLLEGAPTQQARNELAQAASDEKAECLVMLDADLNAGPKELARILSHDEDIVCSLYPHRSLDTAWMVTPTNPPSEQREDGLMRVKQSAIGFSKIRLSVFDRLQKDNPDRVGVLTDRAGDSKRLWDFFSFELVGLNTPESRLQTIKAILERKVDCRLPDDDKSDLVAIGSALETTYLADNLHVSEDYRFNQLCEKSGITVFVDTQLIVSHAAD